MSAAEAEALQKRMSAVLEEGENGEIIGTAQTPAPRKPRDNSRHHGRTLSSPSIASRISLDRPLSITSRSSTSSYRTVEIPSIPAVFNGELTYPNGFTSLTLPRAATSPAKMPDLTSGHVDLTRSGQAQATMATISIIRGGATVLPSVKRRSWTSVAFRRSTNETETPRRLQSGMDSALSFTTSTPTPSDYGPSQMIIKVHAVALSDLDRLLVKTKVFASKPADGYGFVPGRSFVGRVLETGWEVNDVKRGDWVMGLTDFSKSGALAEHLVVDRTRVSRAPKPGVEFWPGGRTLSTAQVAVLPLLAVPARRAVKTFPHAALNHIRISSKKAKDKGKTKEQPSMRVVVLGAHMGVGALVIQELLLRKDLEIAAQVPHDYDPSTVPGHGSVQVYVGEPLEVLAALWGGGYVMVVDCVGGEGIWKAAKRVLDPRCGQVS